MENTLFTGSRVGVARLLISLSAAQSLPYCVMMKSADSLVKGSGSTEACALCELTAPCDSNLFSRLHTDISGVAIFLATTLMGRGVVWLAK